LPATISGAAVEDHADRVLPCERPPQQLEEVRPIPRHHEEPACRLARLGSRPSGDPGTAAPFQEARQREPRLASAARARIPDLERLVAVQA
jgi:hypothetical protein